MSLSTIVADATIDTSSFTTIQSDILVVIGVLVGFVAAIGVAVIGFRVGKAAYMKLGPALSAKIASSAA